MKWFGSLFARSPKENWKTVFKRIRALPPRKNLGASVPFVDVTGFQNTPITIPMRFYPSLMYPKTLHDSHCFLRIETLLLGNLRMALHYDIQYINLGIPFTSANAQWEGFILDGTLKTKIELLKHMLPYPPHQGKGTLQDFFNHIKDVEEWLVKFMVHPDRLAMCQIIDRHYVYMTLKEFVDQGIPQSQWSISYSIHTVAKILNLNIDNQEKLTLLDNDLSIEPYSKALARKTIQGGYL